MAVLSDSDRQEVTNSLMRKYGYSISKTQLRESVNGLDDYIDQNGTALNNAVPLPQRNVLTSDEKAKILAGICLKRAGEI